jgi:DNA (cytosine-5)-methyltransferase 1
MRKNRLGTDPLFLANDELIVDNFAGGGGASCGLELALGRPVDIAINHDPEAVAMHAINHPRTRHYCESVFKVDPEEITQGRPVALAWFSPDCKHFSKAKGGRPVEQKIRGLAWIVIRWARRVKPRVIMLENVEEFQDWGPLTDDGLPCPLRKGKTFLLWVNQLRSCGYRVEWRELRGCDYGAPTIRKRLFLVARRDGYPIVWPKPTHGAGLLPYRTAADCIDWSIPCPSIFERERPLAENTLRRIAKGVMRYVVNHPEPFIARIGQTGGNGAYSNSIHSPLTTVTSKAEHLLVSPYFVPRYGEREGQEPRSRSVVAPMPTIVPTGNHASLVTAFLAQHNTGVVGHDAREPISTLTGKCSHQQVVASSIVKLRGGGNIGQDAREPLRTISAGGQHFGEVRAFLMKYYGTDQDPQLREPLHTITTKDRFGLVMVGGEPYAIADIGMRMLSPRELYRAQGFPDSYRIEFPYNGKPLSKASQVRMCGNSVCPPLARALVDANLVESVELAEVA